jgi:hypothetical protein
MPWGNRGIDRGTRHNRRVRGVGTWSELTLRLHGHERARFGREMGRGTWGKKNSRLYRAERRRDRGRRNLQRRAAVRNYTTAMAVGALILGAVLLISGATRGAGLAVLVLAGLVLYVIVGRKRA